MSTVQPHPASPEEFKRLVREYYVNKKLYYDPTWTSDLIDTEDQQSIGKTDSKEHEINSQEGKSFTVDMPHHPAEETASGDLTDLVAKESKDSTASDHPMHKTDSNATSGGSASAKATEHDHKASPGIVQATDLGEKKGKDELKERAAELNK